MSTRIAVQVLSIEDVSPNAEVARCLERWWGIAAQHVPAVIHKMKVIQANAQGVFAQVVQLKPVRNWAAHQKPDPTVGHHLPPAQHGLGVAVFGTVGSTSRYVAVSAKVNLVQQPYREPLVSSRDHSPKDTNP
jgi:hypothetical protein